MISKELQEQLDYYEQVYFSLDKPIPFKGGLELHPVLVKDYYEFYTGYNCLTLDKNTKTIFDENGREIKVSNPEGIAQSNLGYLISQMESPENGERVTQQIMMLFSLVFHLDRGFYCPKCGKTKKIEEVFVQMMEYENNKVAELSEFIKQNPIKLEDGTVMQEFPKEILDGLRQKSRQEFLMSDAMKCECGDMMQDVFSIKQDKIKKLMIKGVEINSKEFDLLRALIPRQNILDYDDDKYMDPDLKEELAIKARLQNKDYTSPTLEKQIMCVAIGTGYSIESLYNLTMRKLSYFLKLIDKKEMYYAQIQASMSGMVKFKEDPKHWIFSSDKKNIKDELTSLDNFEKKFEHVT